MRVAVLTGGGDCPGLNAVIRAIVRRTMGKYGGEVIGFRYGWAGVIDNQQMNVIRSHHVVRDHQSIAPLGLQ